MIALDTSSVIELMRGTPAIRDVVVDAERRGEEVAISTVTSFELFQRAFHRKLASHERVVRALVASSTVLPFDADAAEEAARIMGSLLRAGKPVNALDAMIAGSAVADGADRLVAFDKDFSKIGEVCDLVVEVLESGRPG